MTLLLLLSIPVFLSCGKSENPDPWTSGKAQHPLSPRIVRLWQVGAPYPDSGAVAFSGIKDIAIGKAETLFVLDGMNRAVHTFGPGGTHLECVRLPHGRGPGETLRPVSLGADTLGHLFLADDLRMKVLVWDTDGQFLREFKLGVRPGRVRVSPDGSALYVTPLLHSGPERVYCYDTSSGDLMWRGVIRDPEAQQVQQAGYLDCLEVGRAWFVYAPFYPYRIRLVDLSGTEVSSFPGDRRGYPKPRRNNLGLLHCSFGVGDLAVDPLGRIMALVRGVDDNSRVRWWIDVFSRDGQALLSVPGDSFCECRLVTHICVGGLGSWYIAGEDPYPRVMKFEVQF